MTSEINQPSYHYTKIRKNVWQIEEDDGVCCTLVLGSKQALLIDTGYGRRNLRSFIEAHLDTPYIVANTHGHPDHIGGNHWFDTVLIPQEEADVIRHFEAEAGAGQPAHYIKNLIPAGQLFSLGDLHVVTIPLPGHTKGSLGFLIKEERLLIAGDALNENLWLFNYGSLPMEQLYHTLKQTVTLDFNSYLCGHSQEEYKKESISAHIKNIEALDLKRCTKQITIGFETYCSSYEDSNSTSHIVFTRDRL